MGEEVAFDDYAGIASPAIVTALRGIAEPPSNPELLAKLLDDHAGTYIALRFAGVDARISAVRHDVRSKLEAIQFAAAGIAHLCGEHPHLDLLQATVEQLLPTEWPDRRRQRFASQLSDVIELLAGIPLNKNDHAFGGGQAGDAAVRAIVTAVGLYFSALGKRFTGAPRRTQTENGFCYPIRSEAAKLTAAVLTLLNVTFTGAELGTHMEAVRKLL